MQYYLVHRSSILSHHGILGQKWGVRRFQNEDGTLTAAGKARYGTQRYGIQIDHKKEDRLVNKSSAAFATKVALGVLTMNPYLIADAVAQGAGAASAARRTADVNAKLAANTNVDKATGLKLKNSEMTQKEDLAMVNPGFKNLQDNSKSNCMLCTTAYDLRRRGYDVTAGKAAVGYNANDVKRWYPKAEYKTVDFERTAVDLFSHKKLIDATTSALASQGEGARGNLMVRWDIGGGHSMAYEVSGGKVRIFDGQSNKIYNDPKKILRDCYSASYARLDNVEPNWKEIKECLAS